MIPGLGRISIAKLTPAEVQAFLNAKLESGLSPRRVQYIRVPAKYPGKRAFKGPNKGKPTGNPLGKNPSDFWRIVSDDWEAEVWDIPNVKANHPEKTEHPCQFPVELVQRCVTALTEGDLVLDPFLGVGSTAIATLTHGRRFIGIEWDPAYLAVAERRIAAFKAGTLKIRPLGRPIHQPRGTERVARIPDEWVRVPIETDPAAEMRDGILPPQLALGGDGGGGHRG